MFSLRILTGLSALPSSSSSSRRCYRRVTAVPVAATLKVSCDADSKGDLVMLKRSSGGGWKREDDVVTAADDGGDDGREEEDEEEGISRIQVPRQKFIPVSKSDLLNGIVSTLFGSRDDDNADLFLLLSSCLESILHAEHKSILEQMRADYFSTQSMEEEDEPTSTRESGGSRRETDSDDVAVNGETSGAVAADSTARIRGLDGYDNLSLPFGDGLDFWSLLSSSIKTGKRSSDKRVAVATRFQLCFMQLLRDAGFEELSARDLALTSALNSDYLLTLPIYVDWKRAAESNAIIFRRGYATERQKGLLIVEKLDYVQSRLLRGIFSTISKPLGQVGKWINEALSEASENQEIQDWIKRMRIWLKELSLFRQTYLNESQISDDFLEVDQPSASDLPIWLAAQRAVSRYEGLLSPVGPREKLFRKLLSWIGIIPPSSETRFQIEDDANVSEPYLRPIFLSRMTLSDIWKPATKRFCGNDVWKRLKASISILLSPSTLQEPAFQELILLYTKDAGEKDNKDEDEAQSLQLKIYERIPIPDLPVIFPHKKLYFRIIDTVRLDVASILGLLAYFINYKFENISSSPSAVFLDVIAVTALFFYATRVVLGYKQTWDRYQLLVNKTLYEKTLASGFGSVHFLLDASEQQQYKEAILAYAIILKTGDSQVACCEGVRDKCERFMYSVFKSKVEMRVEKAINTLVRLGLVAEILVDGKIRLQAVPCAEAYIALKERWNSLLG